MQLQCLCLEVRFCSLLCDVYVCTQSKWNDVESSQSGRIRELQQQCDTALADLAAVRSELEKSRADVETHVIFISQLLQYHHIIFELPMIDT